ncbi:hypothetical protein H0H81_011905 [Sphagnurus paluster]|uniref:Uncharacterized protein n=1 Tax=Sphagnurus paluster TaxID=117069 RepID=A0A9P7FUG2_9AGAR|nr:hypothetical protein H0H81_011905 [Sphagnurus paluster]
MKSLSNSQPGCFGGFTFGSLHRRERRLSPSTSSDSGQNVGANPEPDVTVETLDTALKRREHLLCGAGEEWILNADGPPSYSSPPDYFVSDAKTPRLLDADIVNTIETTLDKISPQLRDLSLKLQARPELAFEEK